jgi:hypothetical protein
MKADRPTAPKVPEVPDTKEGLLAEIGALLDKVDATMAGPRKNIVWFGRYSGTRTELDGVYELSRRLEKLLNPERDPALPGAPEAIRAAFGAEPGTVPSWSRPGTFLVWIDYIPCRCVWGGFADPAVDVVAADPKALWMMPAGAMSLTAYPAIEPQHRSVVDLFADKLRERTNSTQTSGRRGGKPEPAFNLFSLNEHGREAAEQELAKPENAWLVQALKRGPVRPIPLPPHLQSVQLSLIG